VITGSNECERIVEGIGYGSAQKVAPTALTTDPGMAFGTSVVLLGTTLFVMAALYGGARGAMFRFLLAATLLTFITWQQLFWLPEDINDPAKQHIYGPNGDYSGDGITNLMASALGLTPFLFHVGPLIPILLAGGGIYFTYSQSLVAIGILLLTQYSFALGSWLPISNLGALATLSVLHAGIATNLMIFNMAAFIALAMFYRLRVEPR